MKFLQNSVKFHEIWQGFVKEYDPNTYQFYFCDFFPFCDVVLRWLSPKRFSVSADKFWETCQNSEKLAEKLPPPPKLETVSKSDGISSKFGEICHEFVTEHSF